MESRTWYLRELLYIEESMDVHYLVWGVPCGPVLQMIPPNKRTRWKMFVEEEKLIMENMSRPKEPK